MSYTETLLTEQTNHFAAIEEIVDRAKTEERGLTEVEDAECERHQGEAEKLSPQIERWQRLDTTRSDAMKAREASASAPAANRAGRIEIIESVDHHVVRDNAKGKPDGVHRSAGEFVYDSYLQRFRGDAAASERISRALTHLTTDNGAVGANGASIMTGVLPIPFVGDVLGRITANRPVVNSSTRLPLPASGMKWRRPKIKTHTTVAKQTVEKAELATGKFELDFLEAALESFGGANNISIQLIERSDPGVLDMIFADFAGQYAKQTEAAAVAALKAGITSADVTIPVADINDPEGILAAIYTASASVQAATDGSMGNVIYAGSTTWGRLGKMMRPVNAFNTIGTGLPTDINSMQVAGIPVVVSSAFAAGDFFVGNTEYFETVENQGAPVQLQALEVGVAGYQVGVFGMFGSLVTNGGGFVEIVNGA